MKITYADDTSTSLPASALASMEADEDQRVPAAHALKAKELRERYMRDARLALEAATLHMLAEAWDEGYTTGNAHNGRRDANPYRTAK